MKKRLKKKLLAMAVSMTMLAGLMPSASFAAGETVQYKDGTYTGTGTGYGGTITASVTITDGKMTALTSPSHDGESYWNSRNVDALIAAILEANSERITGTDGVDGVTGATRSSNGLKQAVRDALNQAVDSGIFAAGTGTESNPYIIHTPDQLRAFAASVDNGTNYLDQFIALDADLDISGEAWNPAGTEATASAETGTVFNGCFDGQGHTISGLTITGEVTEEYNAGLFSTLGNAASVKNVKLTGVNIALTSPDAALRIGAIAGDTVSGVNEDNAIAARIDSCSAQGSISASTDGAKQIFCGGITGRAGIATAVTNCWTDETLDGVSRGGSHSAYVGGILGMSGNNAKVINCASFGDMHASSPKSTNFGGMAGGIAAMFAGKSWNTAASGNAVIGNAGSAHRWVGALFGENTISGMKNSGSGYIYPDAGAIRDYAYYADSIRLSVETCSQETGEILSTEETETVPAGTGTLANDTVFATSENVRSISNMNTDEFAESMNANLKNVSKLMNAFGMEGLSLRTWTLTDGKVIPNGGIWINEEPDASIFDSGSGTEADPFIIMTPEQMKAFVGSLTEGIDYENNFIQLGADIDISGADWNPVGGSDYGFNGTFDGMNHSIRGMTEGNPSEPRVIDVNTDPYMGLFGVLDMEATVRNLHLTDVAMYLKADSGFYLGGIAGVLYGRATENGSTGAKIDNVSVTGVLQGTAGKGNTWVGGIAGYQYRSTVINSWTDTDIFAEVLEGSAIAEAGGLIGLNNRGLTANCYSLGNTAGKVSRENGAEGAASVSGLISVNGGWMANCYTAGNTEGTGLGAQYNGAVSGWITGTGSTYACWYNKDAVMIADGRTLSEVAAIGTKVPAGVNDEGDAYNGGLADGNNGYTASGYASIAENMNSKFAAFPVDPAKFGLSSSSFKNWKYDEQSKLVTFGDTNAVAVYVQPEVEKIPDPELIPNDGVWFGRAADKSSVVKITVVDHAVTNTEILSGPSEGETYQEACDKALEKAVYGDTSGYGAPDASLFAGGKGTEEDPYQIETEAQLRYIAEALNEDNSWENVYFIQTQDIDVSSAQWLPIGWGIRTTVVDREKQYCVYPFEGHFDGGEHRITGLSIGSAEQPTTDIRAQYLAGLFGVIAGDCPDNGAPDGRRLAEVQNVFVENAVLNVSSRYQNYVGGLIGFAQHGFSVDNCSVTGTVRSRSEDSHARGGGLMAGNIRGLVTNSRANVNVTVETDMGNAYGGGLYGMDNRVATINCYALGDVTADAGYTNRIHIGGLTGQAGGIHYNCYAAGNIIANNECTDVGGLNGRSAGINIEQDCYWNSDAVQRINGADVKEKAAQGADVTSHETNSSFAKTAEELAGEDFAALLNRNRGTMAKKNEELARELESSTAEGTLTQPYYYEGDGSDLKEWTTLSGRTVGFAADEAKPADHSETCASRAFTDLNPDPDFWYHEGVDFAIEKGMMNGVGGDRFDPDGTVTRAMVVTILHRLEGTPASPTSRFRDLEAGSWYEAAVNWAASKGIVLGMSDTEFAPDAKITREQMATILARYARYKGVNTSSLAELGGFRDASSISGYALESIAWAVHASLLRGMDDTTLAPQGSATRAQVAVLMQRMCESVLKEA